MGLAFASFGVDILKDVGLAFFLKETISRKPVQSTGQRLVDS